jgi:hypothetical protein
VALGGAAPVRHFCAHVAPPTDALRRHAASRHKIGALIRHEIGALMAQTRRRFGGTLAAGGGRTDRHPTRVGMWSSG